MLKCNQYSLHLPNNLNNNSMYFFLRVCVIPIALVSWVVFQLFIKKKKFSAIEGDVKVIAFFLAVWVLIYFMILK